MTNRHKFVATVLGPLYKQTSKGQLQQWEISVDGNVVSTTYGLVGGKLQTTVDIVKDGKNIGRSNETTPESQASLQAQQSYDGKLKEGYVLSKEVAASTKNTLDAVEPMLAHSIEKKEKYAVFPALGQPKLDGLRCLAIMKNGKVRLFSRTQKEFLTVPHIVEEIERLFGKSHPNVVLDGELYNHQFKSDFNKITSLIKRDDIHPDHELVQYHIYDVVAPGNFRNRTIPLRELREPVAGKYCQEVETCEIESRDDLEEYQALCIERGYEGVMYRNPTALYEHKRSSGLLKVKTFQDDEFQIVSLEEGHGKLMGKVGAFHCMLNDGSGRTFKAKPACTLEEAEAYWLNGKTFIGKMATVKYQNLTPDKVPRFPILKCIRDYE